MVPGFSEATGFSPTNDVIYSNTWTSSSTTTTSASYRVYTNDSHDTNYDSWGSEVRRNELRAQIQRLRERMFDKGKFFEFSSSREFRAWFAPPVVPKKKFKERNGFQQMCRLPCYRGTRTR